MDANAFIGTAARLVKLDRVIARFVKSEQPDPSICLLIPKTDQAVIQEVKDAVGGVHATAFPRWKIARACLGNGDLNQWEGAAGHNYIRCRNVLPWTGAETCPAGTVVRAQVLFYPIFEDNHGVVRFDVAARLIHMELW